MDYKKAWELLKESDNQEILKQIEIIENKLKNKQINKKENKKIEFDHYNYNNIEQIINELNKYSIEELKQIAKQNSIKITGRKDKEQTINYLAEMMDRRNRKGDAFR